MEEVHERNTYIAPRRDNQSRQDGGSAFGYVVKDAPWNQDAVDVESTSDFPSLRGGVGNGPQGKAWGPWGGQ